MVDLHSHVLPNLDDGAKSVEESLAMLRDSFSQGVDLCVATPHCIIHRPGSISKFLERRQKSYDTLMSAIGDEALPKIILGAEVYMDHDINTHSDIEKLCIQDTPYMLIEFPMGERDKRSEEWLYNLTLKGVKPIIAHVERYPDYKEIIHEFASIDIRYQINASVFLSFGERRRLKELMKYPYKYCIGTDMHNTTSRKCNVAVAYSKSKKYSMELLFENSGKLINK